MRTPIYVLTFTFYDYYDFERLVFASCDLDEVIEKYKEEATNEPLYYNEDLTDKERKELWMSETQHYLITTF